MTALSNISLIAAGALLLAACSNQAVYDGESFASDSPFKKRVEGEAPMVCESARRSLLGQGYLIESASGEELRARKATRGGRQREHLYRDERRLPAGDQGQHTVRHRAAQ